MIKISHIGEPLISEMFNRSLDVKNLFFQKNPTDFSTSQGIVSVPEIQLENCGSLRFDGAHKIDIALLEPGKNLGVAIEAKLGSDRLDKKEFAKRFLSPCGTSHGNQRIKGPIISILERNLPFGFRSEAIMIDHLGVRYSLSENWFLVVRRPILRKWETNGWPPLSKRCHALTIEDIIECYGGKGPFNDLVTEMIRGDYYESWIQKGG